MLVAFSARLRLRVSEQHPRKQGLKLEAAVAPGNGVAVSEQHPRKQGLKPRLRRPWRRAQIASQSNIHENKD